MKWIAAFCTLVAALLAGRQAHAQARPKVSATDALVINVVGDIVYPEGFMFVGEVERQQQLLFRMVQPLLDAGDLNFANLECPYSLRRPPVFGRYSCAPKRLAYALGAGFNLLSLANNHILDAGVAGLLDTLQLLEQSRRPDRPLWWAGVGADAAAAREPARITAANSRSELVFFAVASSNPSGPVASVFDRSLLERIRRAADTGAIVMVSVHFGSEYVHAPTAAIAKRYRAYVAAGADLVVAHHPHVVQGVERYQTGVIFYSLGNFSFATLTRRNVFQGARMYSMLGQVTFRGGQLTRVELVPLFVDNTRNWTLGDRTLPKRYATPQLLGSAFADMALADFERFTAAIPGGQPTKLHRIGQRLFVDLGHGKPSRALTKKLLSRQRRELTAAAAMGGGTRAATDREIRDASGAKPARIGDRYRAP